MTTTTTIRNKGQLTIPFEARRAAHLEEGDVVEVEVVEDADMLTQRELEILRLIAEGLSNAGVAQRLSISQETVKSHVGHIVAILEREVAGHIVLRPKKLIDASQAWFWSEGWQERVRTSVAEIEAGLGERFEDEDAFLAAFDAD